MIGGDDVVKNAKVEAFACLKQPLQIVAPIVRELEQKLTPVTAVRDVPYKTGQEVSIGAWHRLRNP